MLKKLNSKGDAMNNKIKTKVIVLSVISMLVLNGCAPVVIAGAGAAVVGTNVAGSSVDSKTTSSDKSIQFKAVSLLNDYPALKGDSNVEPTVFNHTMLLLGQVPTQSLKDELAQRMAKIPGVKKVYNQLTIGDPVNIDGYFSDSWITSKVVSSLVAEGVNSLHFKVVTQKGTVYIMGMVPREEGQQAAKIAAEVTGVKKVITVYDFIVPQQTHGASAKVDGDEI